MYGNDSVTTVAEQKIMDIGAILSTPVIKEGILYFGSADGKLYAVKID
jgi:eukaryotic-like serine/threonine-protein kinase